MPDSNLSQTLYTTAEAYLSLGYSVIPVWGEADPARPKVAGVEWGLYQRRRPTPSEIHKWFLEDAFGGLAIVTGSISRLAVLDFDTQEGFREFSAQCPDLVERQVIQTRRGYHIYFHLPPHLYLASRKGQGIDLLVDGRYVVARPTCIEGHAYKLIRGGQPKPLTQFDIDSINRFLGNMASVLAPPAPKREFTAFSFDSSGIQQSRRQPQTPLESAYELQSSYRQLIEKGSGRNNALFQVSLKARDNGHSIDMVLAALAHLHVFQPNAPLHHPETPAQRYLEAKRTVQSAFSRPPRLSRQARATDGRQLPNSVREQLFKLSETKVVRVIEGLRLKGIQPGQVFTTNEALDLLKGIVGRDSVYAALKSINEQQPFFQRQNPSPLNPPTPANAATDTKTETTKCFSGRAEKPGISPNHRPAAVYIMPSNDELCLCLGVKSSHSDPIMLEDLATAKQTRQAAHRELIRRRPGIYPRRWLARRLGIGCDTLDTYNREIEGLHARLCFWEQPIYWSNLNAVPDGIDVCGAVLVDETGKRYPAKRKIAAILLGKGRRVIYQRQDANYYWYGDAIPVMSAKGSLQTNRQELEGWQQPMKPIIRSHHLNIQPEPTFTSKTPDRNKPLQRDYHLEIRERHQPGIKLNCRKPLPNERHETLALRVYNTLNKGEGNSVKCISQVTARRLVATYGSQAVEEALILLIKRRNISHPAGFLVSSLKSQAKQANRKSSGI